MAYLCTKLDNSIPEIWMGRQNLWRVMWRNHAPFREDSSSVDWDLLRSTCIPNLQSFIFPHYERRYERQRKKMNLIKQLQEFLKSDHWLRRYWILSGGVFYFEPPCMYCTQAMRPSSKSSFIHSGICVRTLYQFFFQLLKNANRTTVAIYLFTINQSIYFAIRAIGH